MKRFTLSPRLRPLAIALLIAGAGAALFGLGWWLGSQECTTPSPQQVEPNRELPADPDTVRGLPIDSLPPDSLPEAAVSARHKPAAPSADLNFDTVGTVPFAVATLHPRTHQLYLRAHTPQAFDNVLASFPDTVVFAFNAGMFTLALRALGLLVIDGKELVALDTTRNAAGNFYMQPNGVMGIDKNGNGFIYPTQVYAGKAAQLKARYATQSGPMLLLDGKINEQFSATSPNKYIRNGAGIRKDGSVVLAISREACTFYQLASLLKAHGCVQALYLDGAISACYAPALNLNTPLPLNRLGPTLWVTPR